MTDFESRLRDALDEGATGAEVPAGLAQRSRARAGRRRHRTVAVVAAVAVLVLAVPVSLGVLSRGESGPPVVARASEWHTLELVSEAYTADAGPTTVLVDVPGDWAELPTSDCVPWVRYGPPDVGRCSQVETLGAFGTATFDGKYGPGLRPDEDFGTNGGDAAWFGYVTQDNLAIGVSSDDPTTALRILASVRPEGTAPLDVAGPWARRAVDGVSLWTTPELAEEGVVVEVKPRGSGPDSTVAEARPDGEGAWTASVTVGADRRVRVTAPTAALAQLLAGSARPAP